MEIQFDPNSKFKEMTAEQLIFNFGINCGGVLKGFGFYPDVPTDFKQSIFDNLSYPLNFQSVEDNPNLNINDKGTFQYSGDPDMHPVIKFKSINEIVYLYQHGWVVVIDRTTNNKEYARAD